MDIIQYIYILISARGTPLEVLHTLLLGPYKYLLRATMAVVKNNALSCLLFCLHFHHLASPVESQETLQCITSFLLVGILRHWHRWLSLSFHHSWLLHAEIEVWLYFIKGKHLSIYTIFPNSLYNTSCMCLNSLTVTESIQRVWVIMKPLFRILLLLL